MGWGLCKVKVGPGRRHLLEDKACPRGFWASAHCLTAEAPTFHGILSAIQQESLGGSQLVPRTSLPPSSPVTPAPSPEPTGTSQPFHSWPLPGMRSL